MSGELIHYFVEGECEKAFISAFIHASKGEYKLAPGKVEIFNVVTEKISPMKAMSIKRGTKIVFVYDTDVRSIDIFENNINVLKKHAGISLNNIIFVPSVRNFEEEIVRSCSDLKNINDLFGTKGIDEFKRKFINHRGIVSKLLSMGFDLSKMWNQMPDNLFAKYINKSKQIKENIR